MTARLGSDDHARGPLILNLVLDSLAAMGVGIAGGVIATLLPAIARRQGLPAEGLAVLSATPFLAMLVGTTAGRIGPRTPLGFALIRVGGVAALAVCALGPSPVLPVIAAAAFSIAMTVSGPFQVTLWAALYPARRRGGLIGITGTASAGASAVSALGIALLAERFGNSAALTVAGALGAAATCAYAGLRVGPVQDVRQFSPLDSIRVLRRSPVMLLAAGIQVAYSLGMVTASPLFALVQIDRLNLSIDQVGLVGILGSGATTAAMFVWGNISDRWGGSGAMSAARMCGVLGLGAYAVASDFSMVCLAAILLGIANAGVALGFVGLLNQATSSHDRPAMMAGWNAVMGVTGLAMPFIGPAILAARIGDIRAILVACSGLAFLGVVLGGIMSYRRRSSDQRSADLAREQPVDEAS